MDSNFNYDNLSAFAKGYVEAMFFTDAGDDCDPAFEGKTVYDLAPETISQIVNDCAAFKAKHQKVLDHLPATAEQNGHDFWFTRNRHGVGYWDRGYGALGKVLTAWAQKFRELALVVGDDGKLYLE